MARASLSPVFESVRGSIGDLVAKQYGTRVVLSRKPVFVNRRFSKAQKENQALFRRAARYARQLMADPRAREIYEAKARAKGKPVRSLMMVDFRHAQTPPGTGAME